MKSTPCTLLRRARPARTRTRRRTRTRARMHPQARRHVRPRPREHERMHTSARASTCMRMKSVLACIGTSHINHHARLVATCAPSLSLHPPSALSFGGSRSMVTRRGRRCERSRSRDSRLLTPVHTHTHTYADARARESTCKHAAHARGDVALAKHSGPRQGGCYPGNIFFLHGSVLDS